MKFNENPASGSLVVPCGLTVGRGDCNNRFSQQCERAQIGNQWFPNQVPFGTAFSCSISPTIPQLLRPQSWTKLRNMYPISSLVHSIHCVALSMFSCCRTQKTLHVNIKQTNELCPVLDLFRLYCTANGLVLHVNIGSVRGVSFGITSNYTAQRSSDNFTKIPNVHTLIHTQCLLEIFYAIRWSTCIYTICPKNYKMLLRQDFQHKRN
jgi:hypothetical protein